MNILRNLLLGLSLLAMMTACNDGPGDIKISENTSTGRPDSSRTGALSIDESGIVTRYNEQGAVLTIPVETLGGVGKRVTLDVSITGLLDDEGPKGSAEFVLAGGTRLVELLLPGATPTEQQSHQAAKLVRYSAKVAGDDELAFGQRSLYYTLPKIGLRLWAPQRVDAGAQTTVRVWVSDLATGEMLANIPVRSGDQSAVTDTAGQALLNITVPSEGNDFGLIVHADLANISVSSQKLLSLVPAGAPRLFVSTDKPLYRPGQTMHIRALALSQKDLTPIQSSPVILEVLDGKGNKIFKEEAVTDDFGVVSLTAPLASQVNLGDYTIKAVMDDVETGQTVKVSEEKLPKYAVKVDFDQPYFTPGQAVSGVLQARYFFGKAVTGADVKITTDKVGSARVVAFTGTTDSEGLLPFNLDTTGDHHLNLNIEVTDTAGFVVKSVATAAVATPHLQLQIIPEAAQLPNVGPWRFFVTTRGPLGGSVDAECQIVGDDSTAVQTGTAGVAVMESANQQVYVSCKAGAMLGSKKQFMPISGNQSAILVRADKAIYRPGENVELTLVAQNAPDQVYVDRVHRGRIVESRVVSVADGSAQLSMQPTESERGTVIITAYYLDSNGVAFNAERVVYVQKPFAQVKVTTDKDSYLPGGEAKLSFEVKDESGAGQAAAIGVTIADEAVFALAGSVGPSQVKEFFLMGDTPSAISSYAQKEQLDGIQLAAQAGLANSGSLSPSGLAGLDLNQLRGDAKQQYYSTVSQLFNSLKSDLQIAADERFLTVDNAVSKLDALDVFDFWGQRITMSVNVNGRSSHPYLRVKVRSFGPDESEDSWDDVTGNLYVDMPRSTDFMGMPESGASPQDASAMGGSTGGGTDGGGDSGAGTTDGGILDEPELDDLKTKSPKKKRTEFPETLYVNPSLITDGNGKAEVILPMADVITEWRVSMIANTANGRVGGGQGGITVFQDFFVDTDLPRKLTQNDLIELPIGVFNFSDELQEVTVTVTPASWFSLTGSNQKSVAVEAGQSVQVPFSVKVLKAGHHNLEIDASTSSFSDGVIRTVQVMPDGQKYEWSKSGPLEGNLNQKVLFPELAIEGGNDAVLKIMGGSSAQMVDGIEALLRAPRGCFEPMMNSTWINALVLDYMVWTQTDNEALSATTKAHLDDGVQQCVTFECTGGGFTWFGDPDAAHPILSSFALIMMNDIVSVRDIDEGMLKRTQDFLVEKQDFTGAWFTTEGTKNQVVPWDQLRTTCIATWGLASSQYEGGDTLAKAVTYINDAMEKDVDTYTLAMCANALLNAAPGEPNTDSVIAELMDRAVTEGNLTHWGSVDPGFTLAHGEVIDVETTALTAQALFMMEQPPLSLTDGALRYLSSKKSPNGNFMSTQGTIQSLRAFVAAAKFASGETDAKVTVKVGDQTVFSTQIDESNREVVHMVSLSEFTKQSELPVSIEYQGKGKLYWHLASEHYIKWNAETRRAGPLMDIDVTYSKLKMVVGESTMANITIVTNGDGAEPGDMPMVDVGVPPGFDADLSVLDEMVANDPMVPRYEVKGDRIVIYLHDLPAKSGAAFSFKLPLSPRYPMVVTTPSARAWPFYKPEQTSESLPVVLTVN